jgi:phage terminase large subunit-like protein
VLQFLDEDGEPPRRKRGRPPRQPRPPRLSGNAVIDWIEKYCFIPEGAKVGQALRLMRWQKEFIRAIYDNPQATTRRAILSVGRKNGKSSLTAAILLVHLCGVGARRNSQIFSAAQSRDQAALIFGLAAKMIRLSATLRQVVQIHETTKALACPGIGTRYRALSADATTAYGLSPVLVIHDELGLVRGPRSDLFEALETACGAHEDPLSIIISTQAPTDADLLSILIDDAIAGHDPGVVLKLYTAPVEADAFDPDVIAQANPSLGDFLSMKEVLAQANDAKRMPARESRYRNLILNQRVEVEDPFLTPDVWNACNAPVREFDSDVTLYGGLDLSEVADLTALALIGKIDDVWNVKMTFWLPAEGLIEKANADRQPYDVWHQQGYLETTAGKTISYEYAANYVAELFKRYSIDKIGFDRWGWKHFRPWLIKAGIEEQFVDEHFVEFGQGMQSMSPALRELEEIVKNKKLAHGDHPVLKSCVMQTVIVRDDAGNRKPSKRKSSGRIDGLVALAMAVGVAPLGAPEVDIEALIG